MRLRAKATYSSCLCALQSRTERDQSHTYRTSARGTGESHQVPPQLRVGGLPWRQAVVLSAVGVDPADAVEAGEVAVEGTYAGAVLDGESGQMSVRDEVPA